MKSQRNCPTFKSAWMRLQSAVILTSGIVLVTTSVLFSGCSRMKESKPFIGGVTDVIDLPKGAVISNVDLPTNEDKKYSIVTPKPGRWLSLDAQNEMEKGCR